MKADIQYRGWSLGNRFKGRPLYSRAGHLEASSEDFSEVNMSKGSLGSCPPWTSLAFRGFVSNDHQAHRMLGARVAEEACNGVGLVLGVAQDNRGMFWSASATSW